MRYDKHDLVIIGAGASGLAAAIAASSWCNDILIFDRNSVCGKKLAATGNGKCNFTNSVMTGREYSGSDTDTIRAVCSSFTYEDTLAFFRSMGILPYERGGYYYPNSRQASSVRDALRLTAESKGVAFKLNDKVDHVRRSDDGFILNDRYAAGSLIIAAGGASYPVFGTDGSGYGLASELGHSVTRIYPGLSGVKCSDRILKDLAGVRTEGNISLECDGSVVSSEYGEIILNKDYVSGIPVMNLSARAAALVDKGHKACLLIDLIPSMTEDGLYSFVCDRFLGSAHDGSSPFTIVESLDGLLNNKLVYAIIRLSGTDPYMRSVKGAGNSVRRIVSLIKSFRLTITGSNGFENSQVTAGGVPLSEIYPDTMGSRLCSGLFFAGEILDADGQCGGYNLQWAWTTGLIAGACAGGGCFDKDKFIKA